jgi:hypothetical protein
MEVKLCGKVFRKGREPCGRPVADGSALCDVHQPLAGERIQCPTCGQMVRAAHTTRHERICSAVSEPKPYMKKGFNNFAMFAGGAETLLVVGGDADAEMAAVASLREKIIELYNLYVEPMLACSDPYLETGAGEVRVGQWKHRFQERAIYEHMRRHGMTGGPGTNATTAAVPAAAAVEAEVAAAAASVPEETDTRTDADADTNTGTDSDPNRYYIDFGAGKGCLSKEVSMGNTKYPESVYACIEKTSYKHKAEKSRHCRNYRARVDLSDIDLSLLLGSPKLLEQCPKLKSVQDSFLATECLKDVITEPRSSCTCTVVGMGKHLCGSATDLALMALKNLNDAKEDASGNPVFIAGVCIAVCCHGKCSWECTAARPWLESQGIGGADFETMRRWSGYFTDFKEPVGDVDEQSHDAFRKDGADTDTGTDTDIGAGDITGDITGASTRDSDRKADRLQLGRMCKRVVDYGRVQFLRTELGLEARMCSYVDQCITPENVLLIAWLP